MFDTYASMLRASCFGATVLAAIFAIVVPLHASEEVSIDHDGTVLLADFVLPETPAFGGVALITHGTLAHKDMELVEALQGNLADWGIASLAHTISANVSERRGVYDCAVPMTHMPGDAAKEVEAWTAWLKSEGHDTIALVGHGRGARAQATAARTIEPVAMAMLGPMTTKGELRERALYAERFGIDIETSVARAAAAGDKSVPISVPGLFFCKDVEARPETIHAYFAGEAVGTEKLMPSLDSPVLVIAAGDDEFSDDVAEAFASSKEADIRTIESADHLFSNFFADDAAEMIGDFLAGVVPGEGLADPDYGEYLAQECSSCHVAGGSGAVPGIDGIAPGYFRLAMGEYVSKFRENAAMENVARSLGEAELAALAAWFSKQQKAE